MVDIDGYDDSDDDISIKAIESNASYVALKDIVDSYVAGNSPEEVKINEDLYNVDAHSAFSQLCEMTTGISGLRLDLFIDEAKSDA